MGLFSVSFDGTCIVCGEKYTASYKEENGVCSKCLQLKGWKGYSDLKRDIDSQFQGYTLEEWNVISEKRDKLLEPFRNPDGLTVEELKDAGLNYKNYSEEQCSRFVDKLVRSLVPGQLGGFYTKEFIMPSCYPGVAVDVRDVFAVVIDSPTYNGKPDEGDVVSIGFFTNDPAAPMFAIGNVFEVKGFAFKNKKAREALAEELTQLCPNLTYPIMKYDDLKKEIKKDKMVKGNIPEKVLLDKISAGGIAARPFSMKGTFTYYSNDDFFNHYGYVYPNQITMYLLDDRKSRKFWGEKLKISSNAAAKALAASFEVGKFIFGAARFLSRL